MTPPLPTPILACAPNFRDIGGYRGADGGAVRSGRIFRSQLIARPSDDDKAALRRIAIRYVCDLRGAHEREAAPNRWLEEPLPVLSHLDIGMDVRSGAGELLGIIAADPTVNGIRTMMMRTYSLLPGAFAGKLGPFLDALLAVSRDDVDYDYALTEKFTDMERMMAASAQYLTGIVGDKIVPSDAMLRLLCGTSPDYLDAALAVIDADYGSAEAYLEQTAGFDAAKRAALRQLLLA